MAGKKTVEKVWVVQFDNGRQFDPRDLPVGKIQEIAVDFERSWIQVVGAPLVELGVAEAVVRAAAEQVGPEAVVPEPLTARTLTPMFVEVDDDLPVPESKGEDPTGAVT